MPSKDAPARPPRIVAARPAARRQRSTVSAGKFSSPCGSPVLRPAAIPPDCPAVPSIASGRPARSHSQNANCSSAPILRSVDRTIAPPATARGPKNSVKLPTFRDLRNSNPPAKSPAQRKRGKSHGTARYPTHSHRSTPHQAPSGKSMRATRFPFSRVVGLPCSCVFWRAFFEYRAARVARALNQVPLHPPRQCSSPFAALRWLAVNSWFTHRAGEPSNACRYAVARHRATGPRSLQTD
jgi:hypothetical protein